MLSRKQGNRELKLRVRRVQKGAMAGTRIGEQSRAKQRCVQRAQHRSHEHWLPGSASRSMVLPVPAAAAAVVLSFWYSLTSSSPSNAPAELLLSCSLPPHQSHCPRQAPHQLSSNDTLPHIHTAAHPNPGQPAPRLPKRILVHDTCPHPRNPPPAINVFRNPIQTLVLPPFAAAPANIELKL